jgi:hypothetical protein
LTAKGTLPQGNSGQLLDLIAIIASFLRFCWRIGLLHPEQFAAAGELLLAVAVAHETVITDALKSIGQDMDEETPARCLLTGLGFALGAVGVVLAYDWLHP